MTGGLGFSTGTLYQKHPRNLVGAIGGIGRVMKSEHIASTFPVELNIAYPRLFGTIYPLVAQAINELNLSEDALSIHLPTKTPYKSNDYRSFYNVLLGFKGLLNIPIRNFVAHPLEDIECLDPFKTIAPVFIENMGGNGGSFGCRPRDFDEYFKKNFRLCYDVQHALQMPSDIQREWIKEIPSLVGQGLLGEVHISACNTINPEKHELFTLGNHFQIPLFLRLTEAIPSNARFIHEGVMHPNQSTIALIAEKILLRGLLPR